MKSTRLRSIAAALLMAGAASAQLPDEFNAPPANCCLPKTAKSLADQLQDWVQDHGPDRVGGSRTRREVRRR